MSKGIIQLAAIPALAGASLTHGQMYAVNNSDMQSAHRVDQLDQYLFGLPESDAEKALSELFPEIEVGRRFDWYSVSGSAMTEVDDSDVRAPQALFKRVTTDPKTENSTKTVEKGLAMVIDRSMVGAHTTLEREKRRAVKQLRNRLARIEYRRGLELLNASATNADKDWTDADADPDVDVETNVDSLGEPQDTVIYSRTAWSKRRAAYRTKDAANAVVSDHARMGMSEIADFLGVKEVTKDDLPISKGKKDGKAVTYTDKVISYFRGEQGVVSAEEIDQLNPTSVVRFYTPADQGADGVSGNKWGVLEYETERMTVVAVFHYSKMVATNTKNIKKITLTA
ncbi:hypothetical protein [Rubritalea sp.]|uniref:hypothetical protein n=1 Tax=Rubritalea sp. TaxID=2109375 RepID=UPI003EF4F888